MSGVNITVQGIFASSFIANITLPVSSKSLTWNTPNISGSNSGSRIAVPSGTTLSFTGNVSITQGTSSSFALVSGTTLTGVSIGGNFTIDKVSLSLTRGNMDWKVTGDFTMSATTFIVVPPM
jgi:hypothetical protein